MDLLSPVQVTDTATLKTPRVEVTASAAASTASASSEAFQLMKSALGERSKVTPSDARSNTLTPGAPTPKTQLELRSGVPPELRPATQPAVLPEQAFVAAAKLFSTLPENLRLEFQGRKAKLETDFVKLADAVPGMQLNDQARQIMGHVKSAQFELGGHVTIDLKHNFRLPLNNETLGSAVHGLSFGDARQQISFGAAFDPSGDHMRLSNMRGIGVDAIGNRQLQIYDFSLHAAARQDPSLDIVADNPKKFSILRAFSADTTSMQVPLKALSSGLSADTIRGVMHVAHRIEEGLEHRDSVGASIASADLISDSETRVGLQKIIGSVTSVSKKGDSVEILRSGPPITVSAADSEITVAPVIRFKVGHEQGHPAAPPAITSIEGVSLRVPLLKGLGLSTKLKLPLHGLSLDLDRTGKQFVKVHTESAAN